MKNINVAEKMKTFLTPKTKVIKARLFVTREDGITVYDSVQDKTTTSVAALVSGVWQASEALMGMVNKDQNVMEFRLAFDTSEQGIYLFPFELSGKRYFLGAIYKECVNPGQLKRQIALVKEELDRVFAETNPVVKKTTQAPVREGFLFKEITDEEIDRLFQVERN